MQYDPTTATWRGSATDLANHARCEHLTHRVRAREQAIVAGLEQRPDRSNELAVRKGQEFEATWIAARRAEVEAAGGRVLDLTDADPRTRRDQLELAIRDGVELILQAPLGAGAIFGYADALERDEDAAEAAGRLATRHRYRPLELKFARTVQVEHVLQVAAYADALAELQGKLPRTMVVVTGDGLRHEHDPNDYVDYVRQARTRFAGALASDLEPHLAVVPDPVAHCDRCDFRERCAERRREVDHLSLVARIRTDQRAKLRAVGIDTLTTLAQLGEEDRVPGISARTLRQLRTQARLQLEARTAALPPIEYRSPAEEELVRRGFALLPAPDRLDLFFDFEGYPYHESGGLEYLWGWTLVRPDGATDFQYEWADTPEEEELAFERFVGEVERRRALSPGMHVYHYAAYEVTALRRIARRRPEWMARIDDLLRAGVFVDLFAVVSQSMLVGVDSYSIKRLEQLYAGTLRAGAELADGGASIDEYEQWLLTGDQAIRTRIVDYNRDDCDSTLQLRDWLLERRDEAARAGIEWPEPAGTEEDGDDDSATAPEPRAAELLRLRLVAIAEDEAHGDDLRTVARLLSAMPGWGWRIKREFLGQLHAQRHDRDDLDYVADAESIGALELVSAEQASGRAAEGTMDRTYRYPEQVTLVKVEEHAPAAYDGHTALCLGTIREVDHDARTVTIRTSASQQATLDRKLVEAGEQPGRIPTSIVGYADIPYRYLEAAAIGVAGSLLDSLDAGVDPFHPARPRAAALAVLARQAPRVASGAGPDALADPPPPAELADLVARLDASHVVVQGPPGTGKTWTTARLLLDLADRGLRVGISSNSHEAIVTLLEVLDELRGERAAEGRSFPVQVAYKTKRRFGFDWLLEQRENRDARDAIAAGDANVLAGTAWTFCSEDLELDAVLVDEAGQVSLLHATAIAACTSRVVLVGDPQQLPQPSNVAHPHGCDASILGHLFGKAAVLEPARAALLSQTRRMHPSITTFVSDSYYAGRLHAHDDTSVQRVHVPRRPQLPAAGIALLDVPHAGNRIRSEEEADAIVALVRDLLDGGRVVPRPEQPERALEAADVIVVAPYNAQRRLLQERLPAGVRVGTVDKFQGKEAPVAIVSMTASGRDELPRGLEFLLDPHRLNVAISRARALAVLVASPSLRATAANDPHEMRLLNDLARFARLAAAA